MQSVILAVQFSRSLKGEDLLIHFGGYVINVNKKYDVIRARSNASGALGPCSICMCYLMLDAQSALQAPCSCGAQDIRSQWLFFGRNIGLLTLKVIYFHYLKIYFLDQSIQKICYLILKKEALIVMIGTYHVNC